MSLTSHPNTQTPGQPTPENHSNMKASASEAQGVLDEKHGAEAVQTTSSLILPKDAKLQQPAKDMPRLEKWNDSRKTAFRVCMTMVSFIVIGMNDAALGALLPYIEEFYNINYIVVSILFLSPFVGYVMAALSNNFIHNNLGQMGVAIIGPSARLIGYIVLACHPPFPVIPIIMLFEGFGAGLEDSGWNAWIGNMQQANEVMGLLHGAYGLGATIAPLIATAMITKGNLPWWTFYAYVMCVINGVAGIGIITAFWGATGKQHREKHHVAEGGPSTSTRHVVKQSIPWLVAIFLLGYVGVEVSLGGWIPTFELRIRHADPFLAGLTETFFWLGITVGRVILGFITGRIGEKLAITCYLVFSIALQILYWLVPNYAASAVFVSFLGFFLGPLFPAAIIVATKLLPSSQHVSAIGFAASLGGGGAAVLPFVVGAIAQSKGVEVLQPIVLAVFVFLLFVWLSFPGGFKRGGLEQARDNKEGVGHQLVLFYGKLRPQK